MTLTLGEQRLRVLFLASWYPSRLHPVSGIFIHKYAKAVSALCEVGVLYIEKDNCLNSQGYDIVHTLEDNIRTVRVFYSTRNIRFPLLLKIAKAFGYLKGAYLGYKTLEKEGFSKPDIVHLNVVTPSTGLIALILKKLKKIEYVITEHASIYTVQDGRYKSLPFLVKVITKFVFKNAKAMSTVSRYLCQALDQHGLLIPNHYIIPNIVEVPEYKQGLPTKPPFKFITVSLLNDRDKNISGLISAFNALVHKDNHPVELHVIGDGNDKDRLEELARNLGLLNQYVFFHGYVPNEQLKKYFSFAQAFVLNSNYETFSVATVEALSSGLPVVVTKCGGPEEFITPEIGVLVERQDEASLVSGLEHMIKNWKQFDPTRLRNFGRERFGYSKVGKDILAMYRSVLVGSNSKGGYSEDKTDIG